MCKEAGNFSVSCSHGRGDDSWEGILEDMLGPIVLQTTLGPAKFTRICVLTLHFPNPAFQEDMQNRAIALHWEAVCSSVLGRRCRKVACSTSCWYSGGPGDEVSCFSGLNSGGAVKLDWKDRWVEVGKNREVKGRPPVAIAIYILSAMPLKRTYVQPPHELLWVFGELWDGWSCPPRLRKPIVSTSLSANRRAFTPQRLACAANVSFPSQGPAGFRVLIHSLFISKLRHPYEILTHTPSSS